MVAIKRAFWIFATVLALAAFPVGMLFVALPILGLGRLFGLDPIASGKISHPERARP